MSEQEAPVNSESTEKVRNSDRDSLGRFAPGNKVSNRGCRHKATKMLQAMFDGEAGEVGRKALELAKEGDTTALRLVIDRIVPPRKSAPIEIELPPIETIHDAQRALAMIIAAEAAGEITGDEATSLMGHVKMWSEVAAVANFEERLAALEARNTR